MLNKKNILRFSLGAFCLSTVLGIHVALFVEPDKETTKGAARETAVATILGVLGISSFFVGVAFPKE